MESPLWLTSRNNLVGGVWNFGTFFICPIIYWECHHPNCYSLIFFKGVGIPPTIQSSSGFVHDRMTQGPADGTRAAENIPEAVESRCGYGSRNHVGFQNGQNWPTK